MCRRCHRSSSSESNSGLASEAIGKCDPHSGPPDSFAPHSQQPLDENMQVANKCNAVPKSVDEEADSDAARSQKFVDTSEFESSADFQASTPPSK